MTIGWGWYVNFLEALYLSMMCFCTIGFMEGT